MIRPISTLIGIVYTRFAKPIMFLFPADTVHATATQVGRIVQRLPFMSAALRFIWRYDDESLHQELVGIHFENPIGLSAGFDKEVHLPKLMHAIGFGIAEVGSITAEPYAGNPKPWYTRLVHTKSILVHSGLKSSGVMRIAQHADTLSDKTCQSIVINASVARTNFQTPHTLEESIEDYIVSLRRLEQSNWHKMYTINISCPNTAGGEPFNDPKNLRKLLQRIDALAIERPVFLKLPIDLGWDRTRALIDIAAKSTIAGLTIGNLSKDRSQVDADDTLLPTMKGNLSGMPCFAASNELIARTRHTFKDRFVIIGVGGVFSPEDAFLKMQLGADLVELITGMIFQGPSLIGQINKYLAAQVHTRGATSISEIVGTATESYCAHIDERTREQ